MIEQKNSMIIAIAWCLAWGEAREPQFDLSVLNEMRQALQNEKELPQEVREIVEEVNQLDSLKDYFPKTLDELKQLTEKYPTLWNSKIGLIYGGATKIKQYVFEASKLPDIRGASGLLDRINLVDLPAFFKGEESDDFPQCKQAKSYCQQVRNHWLDKPENFPNLANALIPELIIYSTGGNILAFCPAALVEDLANAIEKRYTEETLTANSCAVGDTFRLLEIKFGLLQNPIEKTKWLDWYLQGETKTNPLVEAYFGCPEAGERENWEELFKNRKNFNELVGKLAASFNKRRNGNDLPKVNIGERPSRRYPPIFETHPYLRRDEGDRRSAVFQAKSDPNERNKGLPGDPWLSETLARKRLIGQIAKQEFPASGKLPTWWVDSQLEWDFATPENMEPGAVESWVNKFKRFLRPSHERYYGYYDDIRSSDVEEARSLTEIGNASNGFVGYIYADGNNMGGYIQKQIKNPEDYKSFSKDIFTATEQSVYEALAKHIKPHKLNGLTGEHQQRNGKTIHPFEILTIGGDDVMLIVPANKALQIAKTIGEEFEIILLEGQDIEAKANYRIKDEKIIYDSLDCHRYRIEAEIKPAKCKLSMSIGVLITAVNTPIYYAENLTNQLLKSAKKKAKELKKNYKYHGGTIDFLTMKSVTMISSNIESFRQEGLIKKAAGKPTLKFYGAPYTLHEIGGLIKTAESLKKSEFPRSQLYQIRSLLERGKQTAILNYRYFRVRLKPEQQKLLKENFEQSWCESITNDGNLAPWMFERSMILTKIVLLISVQLLSMKEMQLRYLLLKYLQKSTYETIWRELLDLYPFILETAEQPSKMGVQP